MNLCCWLMSNGTEAKSIKGVFSQNIYLPIVDVDSVLWIVEQEESINHTP